MARVAATILNSKYQTVLLKEAAQLIMWSNEIVQTAFSQLNVSLLAPSACAVTVAADHIKLAAQ
jgi:hypothetical protein